ncbi:prolyl oligopeptidase family serine peptidase [Shewanella gelidii]|uniref:Peptidase S9 prolyl oligopeptidase catalytic domain-containing protein n=1 Tax=Shewanella gelidii TaxID=1642821 RepID=A0A917JPK4_9GAMM|nr:prolyl oligopeptidase family serine peptidase [Shewanella gelidii]MCL1099225.1 prolyl oligopeptidase family serine peptidase [Shewanella gelidii]GGI76601.1 hypothetical protein GCM10009332_12430 [Shewanella gelidii]
MRKLIFVLCLFTTFIAESKPIPTTVLYQPPAIAQIQFAPIEGHLSALVTENGQQYLALIDIESKQYRLLTKFERYDQLEEYVWISGNAIYINMHRKNKNYKILLELSNLDGKIKTKNYSLPKNGYLVSTLNSEPNLLLYAQKKDKGETGNQLYKISIKQLIEKDFKQSIIIESKLKDVIYFAHDDTSNMLFAVTYQAENNTISVKHRNLEQQEWNDIYQINDANQTFQPISFIDNKTLAVLSNEQTDKVALYKFDIHTQKLTDIIFEHPKYDLVYATPNNSTGKIESVSYFEHGVLKRHHLEKVHFDETVNTSISSKFPSKNYNIITTSTDRKKLVVFVFSSSDPGSFYLLDNEDKRFSLLTEISPELSKYDFNTTEAFVAESELGINIEGYLTLPTTSTANRTLIVIPHGGPIGVRDYSGYFNEETQFFTSRGYAVLRVNFRGSLGYGKKFMESGKGEFGKSIEKDITAAVNHVNKTHQFKNKCVMGASYGGYSSMMLAIMHPNEYQCVIGAYGVYDLPLLFNSYNFNMSDDAKKSIEEIVGLENSELLNYSPVYLAKYINSPVLLIAGKDDLIASIEHSLRMEYVLKHFNANVETLFYDETGHGHISTKWRRHELAYIADYIQRQLNHEQKPKRTPLDPVDEQLLAKDIAMIADGFNFDNRAPSNIDKALEYYLKADKMLHTRSANNAGYLLLRKGDLILEESKHNQNPISDAIPPNAQKYIADAIKFYKKAANKNDVNSHTSLGHIYREGRYAARDLEQSLHHYSTAAKLGSNAEVFIQMAKIYCLYYESNRDVEKCTQLLSLKNIKSDSENKPFNAVNNKTRNTQREALVQIFTEGKFDSSELKLLQEMVANEFKYKHHEFEIDDIEFGLAEHSKRHWRWDIINSPERLSRTKNVDLALIYEIDFLHASRSDKTALFATWTHISPNGYRKNIARHLLYGNDKGQWSSKVSVGGPNEWPGKVEATLVDLNGKVLVKKSIQLF